MCQSGLKNIAVTKVYNILGSTKMIKYVFLIDIHIKIYLFRKIVYV